jgi:hypothetical protein
VVRHWLVSALLASMTLGFGCAGSRLRAPAGRTTMGEIADAAGVVVYPRESNSPFVVAVIPELHHLPRCQKRVLAMLDRLRSRTAFVAVEGRIGEVRHDELGGALRVQDDELVMLAQLTERPANERLALPEAWMAEGAVYPRDGLGNLPIEAALLHEAVHQDEVRSEGLEDTEAYRRANRAASTYQRAGGSAPWSTIVYARNKVFVKKLAYYGRWLSAPGRDVVAFPVGAFHVNDLTRRLRRAKIAYAVLVDDACLGR